MYVTDSARELIQQARVAARALKHDYVGSEHLLLSLIRQRDKQAMKVLQSAGIDPNALARRIVEITGEGKAPPSDPILYARSALKSIDCACTIATPYLSPAHILLGLLREDRGIAARALSSRGANLKQMERYLRDHQEAGRPDISDVKPISDFERLGEKRSLCGSIKWALRISLFTSANAREMEATWKHAGMFDRSEEWEEEAKRRWAAYCADKDDAGWRAARKGYVFRSPDERTEYNVLVFAALSAGQDAVAELRRRTSALSTEGRVEGLWLWGVVGIPFLILGLTRGWGDVFRSGDAAIFVSGAITATLAENIGEQAKGGFRYLRGYAKTRHRPHWEQDEHGNVIFYRRIDYRATVYIIGVLIWNLYFAAAAKSNEGSSVDWVQIVAFGLAVTELARVRFAFTKPTQVRVITSEWKESAVLDEAAQNK